MTHRTFLIKPASSLCNLRCTYCFYADVASLRDVKSFGLMSQDVMTSMIDRIFADLRDGDAVTFLFQGGEPTLAGLRYFRAFTAYVDAHPKQIAVEYGIQTNGTLLNDDWATFFKEHAFLVGISLDTSADAHNMNRPDSKGRGTFDRVLASKHLLERHGVEHNVLCVLTEELSRHPDDVFRFMVDNHIGYIQFIPCLDDLHAPQRSTFALTPEGFAAFYNRLYALWLEEFEAGRYYSVNFFDNVLQLIVNRRASACGFTGQCGVQNVIEADGSTYSCDFYVLDEYRIGNITTDSVDKMWRHPNVPKFLTSRKRLPARCESCQFLRMCHGGCKRMDNVMYVNADNTFCGYQDFLATNTYGLNRAAAIVANPARMANVTQMHPTTT